MAHKDKDLLFWREAKDELVILAKALALDAMETPILQGKKLDGTAMSTSEVAAYNSLVATNNEGIRDYVRRLISELKTVEGDEDDGGT